jgi:hypothetical protein
MLIPEVHRERMRRVVAWTPNVDAAYIGVSAHNGVVTLSRVVDSLAEEQAIRWVKGVQGIAVRPPAAHKEIADPALRILSPHWRQ